MGTMRFLVTIIYKTQYQELKDSDTFYTEFTVLELMEHLRKCSGVCHAIDAVDIMSNMKHYFDEASSIPV